MADASPTTACRACSRLSPSPVATGGTLGLKAIERTELLILDDWSLSVLSVPERRDLLEILEDHLPRHNFDRLEC
ncbi:hypothetical protein [Paracoccus liaowanqingii]|uniref:hypothetical protein n=1 Tax=Paracoccus liaowanqingii TaxID=2560053 RepID=UPI0023EF50E5|nr:hypothetical protein [Paracoccus liaowanqingii]